MGYAAYFLIVQDLLIMRSKGIQVGPGGSAAGVLSPWG